MKSVSFIICNDHHEPVRDVIAVFQALAGKIGLEYEILVYGDREGSEGGDNYPHTRFFNIQRTISSFVPGAIRDGLKRAAHDHIFLMSTPEIPPESSVVHLLEGLRQYDMMLGSRLRHDHHLRMAVYRWGWHKLTRSLFKLHISDINCPWKAFRRDKLSNISYFEGDNTLIHTELVTKAWAHGLKIAEIPVVKYYPMRNPTQRFGVRDVLRNLIRLFRLRHQIAKDQSRQQDESDFHDSWASGIDVSELLVEEIFQAVTAPENRYALEVMNDIKGRRILDIGCGAGETSVYFAKLGARVTAIDISKEMIEVTKDLAERYGVDLEARTMIVEDMDLPDNHFDYVFGNGVLHHLNRRHAYQEIHRVLRPGGKAVFIEPLCYNPVISLYRIIANTVRTKNEQPFKFGDFGILDKIFAKVSHREFWLFSQWLFIRFFLIERVSPRKERYWKKVIKDAPRLESKYLRLARLDAAIMKYIPWLSRFCWNTVMVLEKEKSVPNLVEQWMETVGSVQTEVATENTGTSAKKNNSLLEV